MQFKITKTNLFVVLLFIIANRFFFIGPWWKQAGTIDVADAGNVIIVVSILFLFIFSKHKNLLLNPLTVLVFVYLSLVFAHFWLAQLNYQQSFFDSLIATRHQAYFLALLVFVILLKDVETIISVLDALLAIAIIVFFLSIINYFGITIFYHKWAKGHGVRLGLVRTFIPSMNLISFATLWTFNKWLANDFPSSLQNKWALVLLIIAHFLRQTRMRLIGLFLTIGWMLIYCGKFKKFLLLIAIGFSLTLVTSVTMKRNIVSESFVSAYNNYVNKSGTWAPRMRQIQRDINVFKKNPIMGNGLSAVRHGGNKWRQFNTRQITSKSDLGYTSWLKFYGIIGLIWFFLFFGYQIYMVRKVEKRGANNIKGIKVINSFNFSYLVYILSTFVTLNSLMSPQDILLITLNAAVILRLYVISQ